MRVGLRLTPTLILTLNLTLTLAPTLTLTLTLTLSLTLTLTLTLILTLTLTLTAATSQPDSHTQRPVAASHSPWPEQPAVPAHVSTAQSTPGQGQD